MADPQTVIEGTLKYRDNKKWKPRWCVIRKLSPVADCLHLQLYRDSKDRCKNGPTKASLSLEGFLGLETGFTLDKESNTMALICSEVVAVLAFDSRELLIQWQVKVRANLTEEHQFLVQVAAAPPRSKLSSGPARLHLLDYLFCLTAGVPPRLLGVWPLRELRRFGVVDGKFCFEGGSRCGKGEGLHVLLTNQAKDLVQAFDMASRGRLPGKRKVSVRKNSNGVDSGSRSSASNTLSSKGLIEGDRSHFADGTCGSDSCAKTPLAELGGSDGGKGAPCHFHYRWPSCIVPCGAEEGAAKTLGRTTGGGGHSRNATEGQMMWTVGHCQGCGVHYCRRRSNDKENAAPGGADEPPGGFTPQWTMDLGIVSPTKDSPVESGTVQTRTGSRNRTGKAPHDRSSLCSQSSQSSSASSSTTSSSTSSSEYSVPKNCLESFYDRPKNVHFPYNRLSLAEDTKDSAPANPQNRPLNPIREGPCTCWKQQKDHSAISHELLLFGGGLLCSCWGGNQGPPLQHVPTPQPDTDMPSVSSSGSSNASPSTSPKKQLQLPLVSVPVLLTCTCGKAGQQPASNPYLNYAVPRPGAPVRVKEDATHKTSTATFTGDSVNQQEAKIINRVDNANIPTDDKEDNGNLIRRSGVPQPRTAPHPQQQVCPCQRLLLCPGMVPPWGRGTPLGDRRTGGRNSSEYGSVNPKVDNENVKRRGADHNLNCRQQALAVCPQPECCCCSRMPFAMPFLNASGRTGRKDNANHIYVNLKYLQETAAAMGATHGGKLIPYYANLHFLQTLSLYENADVLDVRHSTGATIPEGDVLDTTAVDTATKKPIAKKKLELPSNNGVYEMMSFNQSAYASSTADNYLLMQPGMSDTKCELTAASGESLAIAAITTTVTTTSSTLSPVMSTPAAIPSDPEAPAPEHGTSILPLRPFMPVLLPFHEHTCEETKDNAECSTCKSDLVRKCSEDCCCYRSSRSSSLGDIKVSTCKRGRSSSTDGRTDCDHPCTDQDACPHGPHAACCASPRSTPVRKHPLLTKLTLRSKEKSFSTDDITPPSSAPSSPDSMFLENIHKYPFHRSADCLQLTEEYRLSEEDLSQDPEVIMSQSMEKSRLSSSTIKRSSSVPCKTNTSNQAHPTGQTDSGATTHQVPGGGPGAVFSHFIAYHGSLPRRHTGNGASRHLVQPDRKVQSSKLQQDQQKPALDPSKMIYISAECKQCHQFVTSPEGLLVLDAKSMTSSSSSDMSDYIESLSLCSRSSSGSGSSGCGGLVGTGDYARTDDLCNSLCGNKVPPSSCTLRPRSGKEYHTFDRVLIQDGCPYIPLTTDCSHLMNLPCLKQFETMTDGQSDNANLNVTTNNINNNNNRGSTNSPSPGYVSCSPGGTDFSTSPQQQTTHFTFPKDGKELNYLEVVSVGDSEPTSPVVKQHQNGSQNATVQYAVIDMVATVAARKLSTERAQLRNEGRSPTPTECSPKHGLSEDMEDKKC